MTIESQLREAAEKAWSRENSSDGESMKAARKFRELANPQNILALLDELSVLRERSAIFESAFQEAFADSYTGAEDAFQKAKCGYLAAVIAENDLARKAVQDFFDTSRRKEIPVDSPEKIKGDIPWSVYVRHLNEARSEARKAAIEECRQIAERWRELLPHDYRTGIRKLVWQEVSGYIMCEIRELGDVNNGK